MTVWAVLLAFVAAMNPFRRRRCLSVLDGRQVVVGATVGLVAYALLALLGATVRDALDVSTPNMRIAAGLVLVAVGLHAVVAPLPAQPAVVERPGGWLVPVLFPALLRPDLALVAFAADGTSGVFVVVLGAAFALAATTAWWFARRPDANRFFERNCGSGLGVVTVAAAVRLLIDGVFAL